MQVNLQDELLEYCKNDQNCNTIDAHKVTNFIWGSFYPMEYYCYDKSKSFQNCQREARSFYAKMNHQEVPKSDLVREMNEFYKSCKVEIKSHGKCFALQA